MPSMPISLIAVQSYKGGVGKSTVSTLLGLAFAASRRTCLVDLDLLAPGLHHLLGLFPVGPSITDFLVTREDRDWTRVPAEQICRKASPDLVGAGQLDLFLVHGRMGSRIAQSVLSYLLAEERAGLVQARLEKMLHDLYRKWKIEVFVLDTPPSLFGMSAAARALVRRHKGTTVHVATPTRQDLAGSMTKLTELENLRLATETATETERSLEVFLLNRYPGSVSGLDVQSKVERAVALALGPFGKSRGQIKQIQHWLGHFKVAYLPENDAIQMLARVMIEEEERRPHLDQVLLAPIRQLAKELSS